MKRIFPLLILGALAVGAHAKPLPLVGLGGTQVRAGYYFGSEFQGTNKKIKLSGATLGADFNLLTLPLGASISLSPTVQWGGSLASGSDADGTIYRILATGRVPIPGSGFYAVGGLGYATSTKRGSTVFNTKASAAMQIGIGKTLEAPALKPFVEFSYHAGGKVYRGFSLELGLRF
jgi:opacity protein-like surface antigen